MQVDNLHEEIVFDKSTRRNGCFFTTKTMPAQVTLVGQNPSCAGVKRVLCGRAVGVCTSHVSHCRTVSLTTGSLFSFVVERDFSVGFLVNLDVSVHVDFFHDPGFALQLTLHLEFVETVTSVHAA